MDTIVKKEIEAFIVKTKTLVISAIDKNGIPILKGVTKLGNDGWKAIYFCTSPNSAFFKWYIKNPLVSVYLFDDDPNTPYPSENEKYYALSLIGTMESVQNAEIKKRFLSEYLLKFYPDGVNDKNYHLIRFVTHSGKYYRGVTDNFLTLDFAASPDVK